MKKLLLLIPLLIFAIPSINAEAFTITRDVGIGGFSYYIDELLSKGYSTSDLINESGVYPTDDEYEILYRVVGSEAAGCTVEQKMNVCSCVLVRLLSKEWPNTISGVVFQEMQFAVVRNGSYYSTPIDASTIQAVNAVVKDVGLTHDCEFFCSYGCSNTWFAKKGEPVFKDGVHRYYH